MYRSTLPLLGLVAIATAVPACTTTSSPASDARATQLDAAATSEIDAAAGSDAGTMPDAVPAADASATAPVILDLSTNSPVLTEIGELIITAIVTDPDGIDDVIGGQLQNGDGSATFKAFATAATEGAYSATLNWGELHAVAPIRAPAGGEPITFRVTFFDQSGERTSQTFVVQLRCTETAYGICDSICYDLATNEEHCGACDTPVQTEWAHCEGGVELCDYAGDFACDGVCVDLQTSSNHCGACNQPVTVEDAYCWDGVQQCSDSEVVCNNRCVDLQTSQQHCGACNQPVTTPGVSCVQGEPTCDASSLLYCDGGCVNPRTNRLHCGGCNQPVTGPSASCINGDPACDYDRYLLCDRACVENSTTENCGSCNNDCRVRSQALGGNQAACISQECYVVASFETYYDTCGTACETIGGGATCLANQSYLDNRIAIDCRGDGDADAGCYYYEPTTASAPEACDVYKTWPADCSSKNYLLHYCGNAEYEFVSTSCVCAL